MRQLGGIRNKITFWFYLVLTFMVGSSVVTYGIVRALETKHFSIEKADLFLENILEVRRMEKNFLLYHDQESMDQWLLYLDSTSLQLHANKALFIKLSSPSDVDKVQQALNAYSTIFESFQENPNNKETILKIREYGKTLTTLTEELIVKEHQTIHRLLGLISNSLLFMLPLLVLVFSTVAALLGRGIVSSLKELEHHAATIARGHFVEVPFSSTNREINGLINAFNRMSRELKTRQQRLVRSEKLASLGTMLAGVAHEFNNPLSNISSSAQILAEELTDHKDSFSKELVEQISSETNRAAAIIKTLLSLAREENFHREHYQLRPLWQEIIDLLRGQVAKDIEIHLNISADIKIFADKQKIQQVFVNLLKNSFDALEGSGNIHIEAWQHQTQLKMRISDDGPGIPQQLQGKIFDPFFTTKDTGQGSGLGLFIIHDIIVQHGGLITSDSTNKGTSFTITLPTGEINQ